MTTLDTLLAEAILKGVNKLSIRDIDIADITDTDNFDDRWFCDDVWGWRPLTDAECGVIVHLKHNQLVEAQDWPSERCDVAEPDEAIDTLLGFAMPDGTVTHYRVRGWSVLMLAKRSGMVTLGNPND